MAQETKGRDMFTSDEASEIRTLLDGIPYPRRAERRIAMARLRRMGVGMAGHPQAHPTPERFEALLNSGLLRVDEGAVAAIAPLSSSNVFRVAVGVRGQPVSETWSAFDQRYQWFGKAPQNITSGSHLFVLAVDRWRSAVVGLYEAVSAGAAKLPNSPDPDRWPWAVGVRPLAALPPLQAEHVEGQIGPQSGLPAQIADPKAREQLYRVLADSPPPPGPTRLEQRVQEVEWIDVLPDVLEAVESLGGTGRAPEITTRAIELGEWSEEELAARAWYTGGGSDSHVEHILGQVLLFAQGSKGDLLQVHGVYSLTGNRIDGDFGVPYRPAAGEGPPNGTELPAHLVDLTELDRATKRHMELQDRLADAVRAGGIEPRSPAGSQPAFDIAFANDEKQFVVEVKSGDPTSAQQVRLGVGQVLEYSHLLGIDASTKVEPVLLIEAEPPYPWGELAGELGVKLLRADRLEESLRALLHGKP